MDKVPQSIVVDVLCTSYRNVTIIFLFVFDGQVALFSDDTRTVFEVENSKGLYIIDINKGTNLQREMKISLEDCKSTFYCPVLLSELTFSVSDE